MKANEELRAITKEECTRDRAVTISSTMPSARYSCSGQILKRQNSQLTKVVGGNGRPSAGWHSGALSRAPCDMVSVGKVEEDPAAVERHDAAGSGPRIVDRGAVQ